MPTGYTSALLEKPDMKFKEFALLCSRAFGALVMMRDDPMDAEIPAEFKPSDYHVKALRSAAGRKGRLKQLTPRQIKAAADAETLESIRYHIEAQAKAIDQEKTYRSMLAQVEAWEPPTADHAGLKKFMIEQITGSIDFDCGKDYHEKGVGKALAMDPKTWLKEKRDSIQQDLEYHKKENIEEVSRAKQRTDWIQKLMLSLGVAPKPITPAPGTKGQCHDFIPHAPGTAPENPLMNAADRQAWKARKKAEKEGKIPVAQLT